MAGPILICFGYGSCIIESVHEPLSGVHSKRFQSAVEGLGSERNEAKIGAAITLRTFLRPGYEQFYTQTFDLTVANLRLQRTLKPPEDPTIPQPLTSLSQALIVVFKEAFPLARDQEIRSPQSLDATGIQLDNAYLNGADLKQIWMPQAFLRKAELRGAKLGGAKLYEADLRGAKFSGADLHEANLSRANLRGTGLRNAKLREADLRTADLRTADLRGAKLSGADLSGADLSGADLSGADLEGALYLNATRLHDVKGLTKEVLEACKAKGAIIDEDVIVSSSQSTISPSPSSQNNDVQAQSATPTRGNIPTSDTGGNTATSSQLNPGGVKEAL